MNRVARNYAKLRGECAFEAQNVVTCSEEGGKKKECRRYVEQFKRCLLDEWCHDEKRKLEDCIERNRSRMTRDDLVSFCTLQVQEVDRCMAPRMAALEN